MNKSALIGAGTIVVIVAVGALTYQHSVKMTSADPPQNGKCSSTCQEEISASAIFGKCWLSVDDSPLTVVKNTSLSWTLSPLGGDRVEFYGPGIVIKNDAAGDFTPPTIDSSGTTVTTSATGVASGNQLEYVLYARRIKAGGPADSVNCWATNPLIVNVAQ